MYWTGQFQPREQILKVSRVKLSGYNLKNSADKAEGSPFHFFQHCATFFEMFVLSPKGPLSLFNFIELPLVIFGVMRYIRRFIQTILRFSKEEAEVLENRLGF